MKRMTQKKAVFYVLWQSHKQKPEEYVPAWRFVGELHIKEINEWFFMSYKCPANGVAIYFENPGLIERRMTTGKTGAKYYEYRLTPNPTMQMIADEDLRDFAKRVETEYEINNTRHHAKDSTKSPYPTAQLALL